MPEDLPTRLCEDYTRQGTCREPVVAGMEAVGPYLKRPQAGKKKSKMRQADTWSQKFAGDDIINIIIDVDGSADSLEEAEALTAHHVAQTKVVLGEILEMS